MSAFAKLGEVVTTGSQSTISFTSIPATFRSLQLVVTGRSTTAAAVIDVALQFNGDVGANYDTAQTNRFATNVNRGSTSLKVGVIAAASQAAGVACSFVSYIPDYRGTAFQKTVSSMSALKVGVSSDNEITGYYAIGGFWRSTAAISSILLAPAAGNFVDGTVASLYGIE